MGSSDPPVSGERRKKGEVLELRGLPSVEAAREARRRRSLGARMWLWMGVAGAMVLVFWWKFHDGTIGEQRTSLLSRQREVAARLGQPWFELREKVERWTQECAADELTEVAPSDLVERWDFRDRPGIYLRLGHQHARDVEAIRDAARRSLHDGFSACLFRMENPNQLAGPDCTTTRDCPPGQLCNELNHCVEPSQPYNLRVAYKAMHVLSDEWIADIQALRNGVELQAVTQSFDAAEKYDLPIAGDLIRQAEYFLVVVDEPPPAGAAALPELPESEASDDRSIATAPHPARVCLWRLEDGEKVMAIRRDAAGELMGGGGLADNPGTWAARQRQANSCALALSVREAIGAVGGK